MKIKLKYHECPYCGRYIPPSYDFNEHKKICKNVDEDYRNSINPNKIYKNGKYIDKGAQNV